MEVRESSNHTNIVDEWIWDAMAGDFSNFLDEETHVMELGLRGILREKDKRPCPGFTRGIMPVSGSKEDIGLVVEESRLDQRMERNGGSRRKGRRSAGEKRMKHGNELG